MNETEIQALLPLVARLTDLYTSRESSSVPYETAQRLMEAVLYTIKEVTEPEKSEFYGTPILSLVQNETALFTEKANTANTTTSFLQCSKDRAQTESFFSDCYENGKQVLLQKATAAKAIYESLLPDFCDYHCLNYKETILDGISAFFTNYDYRFYPQNHILTLDYPLLNPLPDSLCGIDLILFYLQGIYFEQHLLTRFDSIFISLLLEQEHPDYQELYLDNLCAPVLEHMLYCIILEHPLTELYFSESEQNQLKLYFTDLTLDQASHKVTILLEQLFGDHHIQARYFSSYARTATVRILQKLTSNSFVTCAAKRTTAKKDRHD